MNTEDLRISKLRMYLFNIVEELNTNIVQINANMLSNEVDNYSLDKIPTRTEVEQWIIGPSVKKDVYTFRSRVSYSQDVINNLLNVGFFEMFERKIKENNNNGILPDIENIEKIECLNCGALKNTETNTAVFEIQIQVTYREYEEEKIISL